MFPRPTSGTAISSDGYIRQYLLSFLIGRVQLPIRIDGAIGWFFTSEMNSHDSGDTGGVIIREYEGG